MCDLHWVWPHNQSCTTTKTLIKNCTIQTRCLYETLIRQLAILAHDNLTKPNNLRNRSPDSFRPGRQSRIITSHHLFRRTQDFDPPQKYNRAHTRTFALIHIRT